MPECKLYHIKGAGPNLNHHCNQQWWAINPNASWLLGWLVGWVIGYLVGWFSAWLAGWQAGVLAGWLVG